MLYPIRFTPIFKDRIWGGKKLKFFLKKPIRYARQVGESWEISGIEGNETLVRNGKYEDTSLTDLIKEFKGDLVGKKVYQKYGNYFPLLIKIIDANDQLSIQVHPDDEMAELFHETPGKTEMWYIIDADPEATLTSGFKTKQTKESVASAIQENKLLELLNEVPVKAGNAFFIPAGHIHTIGKGIILAEIQQASDITYRLYDYDRVNSNGMPRELNIKRGLMALDYDQVGTGKLKYGKSYNTPHEVVNCDKFNTNIVHLKDGLYRNYKDLDSFVIIICTSGSLRLQTDNGLETLKLGETIFIPASMKQVYFESDEKSTFLEVYMP